MNPEIKAKWVAALRSGQYKQGDNWLHNKETDAYCCLGVLQCVHPGLEKADDSELLDDAALEFLDLDSFEQSDLAKMNDDTHIVSEGMKHVYSFADIADHIERAL